MARVEIAQAVLISTAGDVTTGAGASVQVNIRGGAAATVYAAEVGGSTLSNPLTADAAGRIEGWVDSANDYDLVVSGSGFTTYTQPFVIPRGPAGSPGTGANWLGAWSSGTTYAIGDGVSRLGQLYISNTSSNLNHDPSTDTTNWTALAQAGIGVDVWNSQSNPASVTDWGAVITTLMATHPRLWLGNHDFPCTTALNFFSVGNIVFTGESGFKWIDNHAPVTGQSARLIWKGAASSGPFIELAGADSIQFRDLAIIYDNAAYDGDLIACDSPSVAISASCHFENCYLGSETVAGSPLKTARCILRMKESVGHTFFKCSIGGALQGVRGREGSTDVSNDNVFDIINTGHIVNGHFVNVGENWHLNNVVFEFDNCGSTSAGITSDITTASRLWMKDPTWWDPFADTQLCIDQKPANAMELTIHGGCCEGFNGINFNLLGPAALNIENVSFTRASNPGTPAHIDLGTAAGGATKRGRIVGCTHSSGDTTGLLAIANLDGGHPGLWIESGNNAARSVYTHYGVRRLGYSDATADYKPSVAVTAGQPAGLVVEIPHGNCTAGYIHVKNFDASASTAGNFAEITLPSGYVIPSTATGFTHCPIVLLTPAGGYEEGGLGGAGGPTTLNSTRAANVGVIGVSASVFRLNSANAIPSGADLILLYEIFLP